MISYNVEFRDKDGDPCWNNFSDCKNANIARDFNNALREILIFETSIVFVLKNFGYPVNIFKRYLHEFPVILVNESNDSGAITDFKKFRVSHPEIADANNTFFNAYWKDSEIIALMCQI